MQKIGIGFWLGMLVSAGLTLCGVYLLYFGVPAGDKAAPWLFWLCVFPVSLPLLFGVLRILSRRSPLIERFYSNASGTDRPAVGKATGTYRPEVSKATGADRPEVVRFVPHWYMMGAIVFVGLALLSVLIRWILSLLGR